MQRLSLLVVLSLSLGLLVASQPLPYCVHRTESPRVTYDLDNMKGQSYFKETRDILDDYDVWFSVCQNFPKYPATVPADMCNRTTKDGIPLPIGNAYQLKNESGLVSKCKLIGNASPGKMVWEAIDKDEPEVGINQVYAGEPCDASNPSSPPRFFIIEFKCVDICHDRPKISAVTEAPACNYTVTVETCWACPTECHEGATSMCNGHGICDVDVDANTARCYCNEGWAGAQCDHRIGSHKKTEYHTTATLLVIVIILGAALLAVGTFLVRKVRKLNTDESRYSQLAGDPTEAAQGERAKPMLEVHDPETSTGASNSVVLSSSATATAPGVAPVPTGSGVFSLNS